MNFTKISRPILGAIQAASRRLECKLSAPFHRLYVISDGAAWVLSEEAIALASTTRRLGIQTTCVFSGSTRGISSQVIFLTSQFALRNISILELQRNRYTLSYFHGHPQPDYPEFAANLEAFKLAQPYLSRVQVSCSGMEKLLLSTGIDPHKIQRIPIGVDLSLFTVQTSDSKILERRALGIPSNAIVVGSFQKDGNGWGEGLQPKLIKGPDILVQTLAGLYKNFPELHVLLCGPARGYVIGQLQAKGIPYTHVVRDRYDQVARLYQAVDLTLVTSREEGGPKAVLESMAAGVPILSTRVGQAVDLIEHAQNGWLAEVSDVNGLITLGTKILSASESDRTSIIRAGRATAEKQDRVCQDPQWRAFFEGIIEGTCYDQQAVSCS